MGKPYRAAPCHPERQHFARERCRPCYSKDYAEAYPERLKANQERARLRKLGTTPEGFDAQLAAQNGRCAICGESMKRPNQDHDHATGKARGVLCQPCNAMLGMAQDNSVRLMAGAAYLAVWA